MTNVRMLTLIAALHDAGVLPAKPAADLIHHDRPANSNP
jgi:hypothetical protein